MRMKKQRTTRQRLRRAWAFSGVSPNWNPSAASPVGTVIPTRTSMYIKCSWTAGRIFCGLTSSPSVDRASRKRCWLDASSSRCGVQVRLQNHPQPECACAEHRTGGALGDLTRHNSQLLIGEIRESLRRGEADMAALNFVRVDSPLYAVAANAVGWLNRDLCRVVQPHWRMSLPNNAEEVGKGSKDFRELHRKGRKLLADYPDQVRICCFREVDELEP